MGPTCHRVLTWARRAPRSPLLAKPMPMPVGLGAGPSPGGTGQRPAQPSRAAGGADPRHAPRTSHGHDGPRPHTTGPIRLIGRRPLCRNAAGRGPSWRPRETGGGQGGEAPTAPGRRSAKRAPATASEEKAGSPAPAMVRRELCDQLREAVRARHPSTAQASTVRTTSAMTSPAVSDRKPPTTFAALQIPTAHVPLHRRPDAGLASGTSAELEWLPGGCACALGRLLSSPLRISVGACPTCDRRCHATARPRWASCLRQRPASGRRQWPPAISVTHAFTHHAVQCAGCGVSATLARG